MSIDTFGGVEITDVGSGRDGFRIIKLKDGRTFTVKPFKGKQGTRMQASLTKYASQSFGGVLAGIMGQMEGDTEEAKMDALSFAMNGVLQGAFSELDDERFLNFFYELFSCTSKDNVLVDYDEEFTADQGTPILLAVHIITYNFRSVFQQLGIGALLKKKVAKE